MNSMPDSMLDSMHGYEDRSYMPIYVGFVYMACLFLYPWISNYHSDVQAPIILVAVFVVMIAFICYTAYVSLLLMAYPILEMFSKIWRKFNER